MEPQFFVGRSGLTRSPLIAYQDLAGRGPIPAVVFRVARLLVVFGFHVICEAAYGMADRVAEWAGSQLQWR